MRKIVAALVAALLALTLAGCGGGGEEAPAAEDTPVATPAADAPAEPVEPDKSANDSDTLPAPFPSFTATDTPAVFQDKLDEGRPMLIFFYDDTQQVTSAVRVEVDAVMTEYRGLVDLVMFNIGGPAGDPATLAAVTYAGELSVISTPYIIVVDKGGFITWRSKGFAERAIIQREVERASR